jgi:hypothetical protein
MSNDDILAIMKKQDKKEATPLKENEFSRVAFIIENNDTPDFEEDLDEMLKENPLELASIELQDIKEDFSLIERKNKESLSMYPLYMARYIKSLPVINKILRYLEPISWIVYYCNSKSDLLSALIIQKMGEVPNLREMTEKYTIESVAKYSVLKRLHDYSKSVLDKVG